MTNVTQRRWRKYRERSSTGTKQLRGRERKKKPKCGETERDTGRSVEALVARLPRMLSDSGRLMTDSRGHSESERAGAALQAGAPLSLGQSTQAAQPAPPAATGVPPPVPSIHSSTRPCFFSPQSSQPLMSLTNIKTTGRIVNGARTWKMSAMATHGWERSRPNADTEGWEVHAALRDATMAAGSGSECVLVCV